jgi:hypothetical protein
VASEEHMEDMMSFPVATFKIMKNDLCLERAQGLTKRPALYPDDSCTTRDSDNTEWGAGGLEQHSIVGETTCNYEKGYPKSSIFDSFLKQ